MIIHENTDKKIAIPVGLGVVQTEAVKNFYNTSDATATSADILLDKTAYGKYGKLTGTLDLENEKEISYQDGYESGKIDGYAEGLDDGITDGRNQIIEEQSDANITASDVTRGKIGYSANNEKIVGTSEAFTSIDVGTSGIKFGNSTFTEFPSYYDFSNVRNMSDMFKDCKNLTSISELNTSKVTSMSGTFFGCSSLQHIPFLDTSKVQNMYTTFYGCPMTTYQEFDLSSLDGTLYNAIYPFYVTDTPINLGGFKDVGKGYIARTNYGDIMLQSQSKLTHESCMNVINKVYDLNLNTSYTYTPKIRFHATPYALLSADDIAIATAKGWTVQAG